jgi:hypothetical protein
MIRAVWPFLVGVFLTLVVGGAWLIASDARHPQVTTEYVCRRAARLGAGVSAAQRLWTTAERVDVIQHYLACLRVEGYLNPTLPADLAMGPK